LSFAWSSDPDFPHILSSLEAKRDIILAQFTELTNPSRASFL